MKTRILAVSAAGLLAACAVPDKKPVAVDAPVSEAQQEAAQQVALIPEEKRLKRKVAIGRFTNETRYGKTFLRDGDDDPLGKQASDMLSAGLIDSKGFLIFERPDIAKIHDEQAYQTEATNLIGVDTLIMGSVTEFGRKTTGKSGFFSSTKKQVARATVEIRLVDARTGHAFFSVEGAGEASSEAGNVAGFGNRAEYDATLNDRAIGAAIDNVIGRLISKLEERPWRTDILKIEGDRLYMTGGKFQGIEVGDNLRVMKAGDKIRSQQSGFDIELPATEVGQVTVIALFGESESNEGAIATISQDDFSKLPLADLFITEGEN